MTNLIEKVIAWGHERNLIEGNTVDRQFTKTFEEVMELKAAIEDNDELEQIDAIGDITVTLILLSAIQGWSFEDCLQSAYDVIKNRTGKTVDGVFVKDALPPPDCAHDEALKTHVFGDDDLNEPLGKRECADEESCSSCQ